MYSNTAQASLCKIPFDRVTGKATGPPVTLAKPTLDQLFPDDLTFNFAGKVYMVSDALSEVEIFP